MAKTPATILCTVLFLNLIIAPAPAAEEELPVVETVIALQVGSGAIAPGRDSRIFTVPVKCNGLETRFVWACGGWTMVNEKFAQQVGLKLEKDEETEDIVDASGKPIFAGKADSTIFFGNRAHKVEVKVMRQLAYTKEIVGVIGFDVASTFQWELNPDPKKPTLTLRPPGTRITRPPLAVIPLKMDGDNVWINVKIRNVAEDVMLIPQNSDTQAGPHLQKKWDLTEGKDAGQLAPAGNIRTMKLTGNDVVELSKDIREGEVLMMMVGDRNDPDSTPHARSGLGQSLLNRFVYCVDPKKNEFVILSRVGATATTQPAGPARGR